ncbi:DUF1592 domain-containing protein [Aporhodopirellula aestuarii]|uniref:DUF1592 domain-containing protein n=1 Tax=Aporhodopirellula aestuarii TaxID=2950107 RepID=A0ABT0U980_9BACT|nr:DUF1592 domain-containing protein [Aporhodopirellula aestuarii]MCM2373460.1 DUF1592 domain-containing protein [Aporhodopirellula aestuarii]
MKDSVIRTLALAALVVLPTLTVVAVADDVRSFEQTVLPFFETHCFDCHDQNTQEGDFRLDNLQLDFHAIHTAERWDEVIGRINSGEMPPPDQSRPSAAEIEQVVDWIGRKIKEGEHSRMSQRSSVAFYRLSREEYSHSIFDLLGVHYDTAAPGRMTADPEWKGFERIGSLLSLSPSHVEKYLVAAREILDIAYPQTLANSRTWKKDAIDIDWPNRGRRVVFQEQGIEDQVRTLIWPGHRMSYVEPAHGGYVMPPGIYRAKLRLSGLPSKEGRPPHVAIYCQQLDRMIFEQDVIAPELQPVTLEFETYLEGKITMSVTNEVPGPSNSGRAGRPSGQHVFTTLDHPLSRAPWQRKMTDEDGNALYPFLIFDSIEWEGPIVDETSLAKQTRFLPPDERAIDDVRESLSRFASLAWRRPAKPDEIDRYLSVVNSELQAGTSPRDAFKMGMLGILASQNFYYLREGVPGQHRETLTSWELASRLSHFLWSSMPDAELIAAAEQGSLHEPATLKSQLRRMLADPKIDRFCDSFPRQWLQLAKVGMFPPDEKLYPDYDPWLEKSMVLESTLFFAEVFRRNLSIREFLHSDWTMVNPRLATHYELPPPGDAGFQRVMLNKQSHRGGLLTQASVLSLTSDGTRHRPVHRGIWVSEVIFGRTPNPPPANIDAIEPNPVDQPRATIRMKLAAHTVHAQCAACHRKIDPLGFAFDNYDAVGRWRTEEFVQHGQGKHPTVDASGELPNGQTFDGPDQFKQLLLNHSNQFALAFVEKLATYALRRPMTIDDREAIHAIVIASQKEGFRLQNILEHFVLSDLFLKR